jgi:uncharacterized protein (TIGR02246 family)
MLHLAKCVVVASISIAPAVAIAGPAEDANAAIERWSAAYSANDPAVVAKSYWPDAIVLGTNSPTITEGGEAIENYFAHDIKLKGSGNRNTLQDRRTIVVDDHAVLVTGFYEFVRVTDGRPTSSPSRFTMLLTERNGEWRIAHHNSSPRPQPRN